MLSTAIFSITLILRLVASLYHEKVINIQNYEEHSLENWIQIGGAFIFYLFSTAAIKSKKWTTSQRKVLILSFIIFILLITLGVSYTVSLHNTKNTLTMFLIGIVTVSLFFAIEYEEIIGISTFIVLIFLLSMVLPKITFQEKMMNMLAAFILGAILVAFSRYGYYFKSQHFVRLKQLEEKNIEIERLNVQKSDILAFVAHDLRNPLNNIEALSALLALESESIEAEMIGNSARQGKEIINDLLETVKLDDTKLELENIELTNYFQYIVNKWKTNSSRKIVFKTQLSSIFAYINASKLERVVDNLISNALKFSPEEQSIEIELIKKNQNINISISDHGIGIPEKLQSAIFDQFSTAGRNGLYGEKSIGLGLHISKKIVEQHNGKLLMTSKEEEGTTFTIVL